MLVLGTICNLSAPSVTVCSVKFVVVFASFFFTFGNFRLRLRSQGLGDKGLGVKGLGFHLDFMLCFLSLMTAL